MGLRFLHVCTNLSDEEFFHYYFFCSRDCEVSIFPFYSCTDPSLVKDGIFGKIEAKPTAKSKKRKKNNSSNTVVSSIESKDRRTLLSETVNYNPFLDINCNYANPNNFSSAFLGEEESCFSIFHSNARSLNKNFGKIRDIFVKCNKLPDVLAISETKLNVKSHIPEFKGYDFERFVSPTQAGGVGIYLSKQIDYCMREDLSMGLTACEDLWVNIKLEKKQKCRKSKKRFVENLVIGTIYRHEKCHYNKFTEALSKNLILLSQEKSKVVIVGDVNINLLKFNIVTPVTNYVNSITSLGYNLFIDKPTRITEKTATCIDHVYSNLPTEDLESLILMSDVSDHFSTVTKIEGISKKNVVEDVFVRKSNLSASEWELFNKELQYSLACNLPHSSTDFNVNDYANCITETYKTLIDKYMPLKKLSRKQKRYKNKPWISSGIKKKCCQEK